MGQLILLAVELASFAAITHFFALAVVLLLQV